MEEIYYLVRFFVREYVGMPTREVTFKLFSASHLIPLILILIFNVFVVMYNRNLLIKSD